jgi:hypothetical protein
MIARTITLAIIAMASSLHGRAQPSTPEQIGRWMVEDVWNKGDFSLVGRLFKPQVILHYL